MLQPATRTLDMFENRLNRFVIKAKLGSGGMGEVFLADDSLLKRQVAMKAIRHEHGQGRNFCERLLREAERVSQLNDEHIARIYDIVEHDGRAFLIMEYVEGETLRAKMREPLATEDFFSIAEQCLAGLAVAHRRSILHCDLKPENLMITPAGLVKILDFGFARRADTEETRDSLELNSPTIGGTLAYMAPEVLLGRMPDERADIFSMGVVLYEALAGYHPFREPPRATADCILRGEPRRLPGPVPAGLDLVLLRMLAKDPKQRYQSCADALADVRAVHASRKPALGKTSRTRLRLPLARTAPLLAVAITGALLLLSWPSHPPSPVAPSSRQLVVLPFQPADADANSHAFASGLTETLAAKLGQIADRYPLEIVAASEVRAHKVTDAQQARTILGANLALEGSLQQSGSTVRVIYSLVDTRSLRQVHSGVITADASNPFAVQDRVLEEVLNNLDIELAKEDRGRMGSHGTAQPQAYDSYLRGRGYLQEYDRPENLERAIAAFQNSLKADPRFALAYAGLGQAHLQKYGVAHLSESVAQAQDACSRAVELDGRSPDGEICMGMLFNATGRYREAAQHLELAVKLDAGRDESYRELALAYEGLKRLDDAERSLKQAIALRPQYWAGYKRLGGFYSAHGREEEAVEQFKRVVALAPDSFSGYSNLGAVYALQGNYAEAVAVLERSIAIRPTSSALNNLGAAYFYERKYLEAARIYEHAAQLTPNANVVFGNLGEAYGQIQGKQEESRMNYAQALKLTEQQLSVNAKDDQALSYAALYAARLGEETKAERYRKLALKLSARHPRTRLRSALVLAQLHKDSRALAELDEAVKEGLSGSEITNDPAWQRFAAHPKYVAIIARTQRK
jgi:serine/threonine protein kinase/tetratricopeptide (TPR) repeat protein